MPNSATPLRRSDLERVPERYRPLFGFLLLRQIHRWFVDLPIEAQLAFWFLTGMIVAGQVNRGIYRLAFDKQSISPWSIPDPKAPARHWSDKLPVIGWLGLQRESTIHGRGFWVRPMLIEFCCGAGLAALYWWEVDQGRGVPLLAVREEIPMMAAFLSHAMLLFWLVIATFIDFDERTIPDGVTVPGTILGLLFAAKFPGSLLPVKAPIGHLWMFAPAPWNLWMDGKRGLLLGIACFMAWCFALAHKTWYVRRGLATAIRYLCVSMARTEQNKQIVRMAVVGVATIVLVWSFGDNRWRSLLTALVGMAFGGGLVWSIRIVGSWAAGREAMGFGDVTLMAMIGAYLGWQSTLMVFFLAPFAGIALTVFHKLTSSDAELAFGPFLSLGTLTLIVFWASLWPRWEPLFGLGLVIPAFLAVMLAFLAISLLLIRLIRGSVG